MAVMCTWCGHDPHAAACSRSITVAPESAGGALPQRLYDQYVEAEATDLIGIRVIPARRALVDGVRAFLAEPDPTVEIAYLKAALADAEAERDQLKKRASDGTVSAAEMAAAMYPESDVTYGYQAVREAYEYGYAAAENRLAEVLPPEVQS